MKKEIKEIKEIIALMPKGKRDYETKRALKKGFKSLEKYLESKIIAKTNISISDRVNQERSFWKKTDKRPVVNKNGKQIGSVDSLLFDCQYWWTNKNYKEGVSTQTSKEMMEYFLKWVNQYELQDFSQNAEHSLYSTSILWGCWHQILGLNTFSKKENRHSARFNPEPFKWFNELEHLITKKSIFWGLIDEVWMHGSYFLDTEKVFSRYGRDTVAFSTKQSWLNHKNQMTLNNKRTSMGGKTTKPSNVLLAEMKVTEVVTEINGVIKTFIPVHRSFRVKKGHAIRKGITKLDENRFLNYTQEEGASWSYSTNRFNAVTLGMSISTHHFKKYLGMTDYEASKHIVKKRFVTKDEFKYDPSLKDGYYTVLGTYWVEKKDILFCTTYMGENELVINPSNVVLLDYHFLGIVDHLAVKSCLDLLRNWSDEYIGRGNIQNIADYFDVLKAVIKDLFKEDPKALNQILKSGWGKRSFNVVMNHFCKSFQDDATNKNFFTMIADQYASNETNQVYSSGKILFLGKSPNFSSDKLNRRNISLKQIGWVVDGRSDACQQENNLDAVA